MYESAQVHPEKTEEPIPPSAWSIELMDRLTPIDWPPLDQRSRWIARQAANREMMMFTMIESNNSEVLVKVNGKFLNALFCA